MEIVDQFMVVNALNYNDEATADDYVNYNEDSLAANYNPDAIEDDGSCQYPIDCSGLVAITINMSDSCTGHSDCKEL